MVMNTFRSKLRRRRNELFRRSSDEEGDEWQFVAFNPSVYPSQPSASSSCQKLATLTGANINGNYTDQKTTSHHPRTPVPCQKSALRPWALKRASWHDGPPPVPPHGQSNIVKGQRPLPPCPETSHAPSVPPHNNDPAILTGYPGSVPNWYGSQFTNETGSEYPLSVPIGKCRPPNLNGVVEQPPIVLRRDRPTSSQQSSSRPNSGSVCRVSFSSEDDSPITPDGLPPLVPPHGRPVVPQHHPSSRDPQTIPVLAGDCPPPPPPPPHGKDFTTSYCRDGFPSIAFLHHLPPSPPEGGFPIMSAGLIGDSVTEDTRSFYPLGGEKVSTGNSNKEQRRSDPGGGTPVANSEPLPNHNPSNGASAEDELDDPEHNMSVSQSSVSLDNTVGGPNVVRFLESTWNSNSDSLPNNLSKNASSGKKRSSSSINRSESCKEKQHARKQARENRKNSDPNIPTSKTSDVDGENSLHFQSESSSNSSLSQSQDSPPGNSAEQVEAYASALDNDSDIEADADLPDWTSRLSAEIMESLSSKDRKRQDTINEFFHTEQSHVRVLKVLQYLFHQPLRQSGYISSELLDRLFPNLDQMLRFHTSFNKAMKRRRQESPLVITVGDILESMFEGEEGFQFQQAAAEFVACQSFGLESLKQHQKRDQKLAVFLQDQENHPHCRRLQLKDMLPAGFQRLSKYPLLLESLLSYTDQLKQPEEFERISKALDRSKEILAYVNLAVQDAENHKRLRDIQKRLDQSSLSKNKHGACEELKGEFDLTKHKLVHEGPLTWKTARGQKNIDLHVLILEDCIVLLQKDNDKFILKYHSMNKSLGKDDKLNLSPIIKFGTFFCREVATDKCGIFIILTQSTSNAQIYELAAMSQSERPVWLRHFQEAQASYNAREGRNRRPHPPPHLPDTDDSSTPTELRDVEDGVETENSDSLDTGANESASREKQDSLVDGSLNSTSGATPSAPQTPSSPETVSKKTESLRRKDMKIRQELQEKQNLIADILNIPRQDFESVADMAGEVGLSNKEPRELVLGAIYQAKKLQDSLNDAQTIRDSDIIASQAPPSDEGSAKGALPLYHIPMESMDKLVNISGALTQFLNSLMILISERDEERERMRKELVSSRERVHQLHMQQNIVAASPGSSQAVSASDTAPLLPNLEAAVASPPSSRPSSFMSANSSGADQSDNTDQHHTDEDGRSDDPSSTSEMKTKTETSLEKCEERSGEVLSAPTEAEESRVTRTEAEQEAGLGTT